LYLKDII